MRTLTLDEWYAEADELFGKDSKGKDWKFVCPRCKTVQTGQELLDLGVDEETVKRVAGFSCIGRYTQNKGCDWTLGGLFKIHKLEIKAPDGKTYPMMEFEKPH